MDSEQWTDKEPFRRDALAERLRSFANELGFSLVGIAPATDADTFPHLERWLDNDQHGELAYMQNRREARRHPRSILENVRSVVMLGYEYGGTTDTIPKVAKYAQAPDYHDWLWAKINQLGQFLVEHQPDAVFRGITDSAPLLERDFARRAGLGWFGKNTMLINKRRGSFFLLAALLTNIDLPIDEAHESTHCGTCTACLDACPTDAFVEPHVLDARRCISYLTIELRSQIPEEQRTGIGDWLFGCDICQDVCPWNRNAGLRQVPMPHDVSLAQLDPIELLKLSPTEFRERFKGTSLLRAKRAGLLRNAAIVLGNLGDASALSALEDALNDDEELIRDAARWAITRILSTNVDSAEERLLKDGL